jgi:hypothetical protein
VPPATLKHRKKREEGGSQRATPFPCFGLRQVTGDQWRRRAWGTALPRCGRCDTGGSMHSAPWVSKLPSLGRFGPILLLLFPWAFAFGWSQFGYEHFLVQTLGSMMNVAALSLHGGVRRGAGSRMWPLDSRAPRRRSRSISSWSAMVSLAWIFPSPEFISRFANGCAPGSFNMFPPGMHCSSGHRRLTAPVECYLSRASSLPRP